VDALISVEHAGRIIDAAAIGLLALAIVGVVLRRLEVAIILLAGQGVLLGVASGAAALAEMEWRPWAAFSVALAVKAVAIPVILWFMLQRVAIRHEVETVVPLKLAFPIALGLALLAYWVAEPFSGMVLDGEHSFAAENALPAALGLLLLGLFTMASRKKAITQVIGLVTMENGIYLAAIAATRGLPLAVEFGIAMDVLTGVALMALVTHEINRLFSTINTDRLRSLRG
jgi:hydrogenase-4 component E